MQRWIPFTIVLTRAEYDALLRARDEVVKERDAARQDAAVQRVFIQA